MKTLLFLVAVTLSIQCNSQNYNFPSGTTYTCSGNFYDPGGSSNNYPLNVYSTSTFCSSSGNCIQVTFNSYDIEAGWDYLEIFDGATTSGTLLTTLDGVSSTPLTLSSTSGCLTFRFYSDGYVTEGGWDATISCTPCPANPLSNCTTTAQGTVSAIQCSDIGTSSFYNTISTYNTSNVSSILTNGPSPSSSCGSYADGANYGSWTVFDLDPNIDAIQISTKNFLASGYVPSGYSDMWTTVYQGSDCNNLTEVFCGLTLEYIDDFWLGSGWNVINDHFIDNIDPNLPVYIYTSYSHNDWVCENMQILGFEELATNESCGTAISSSTGCNLGAPSETSWTGPTNNGETCTGGTWYSNENTVYYTFTATDANATIDVENVVCNDGTTGEIQIAVWEDCADVGTYNSSFLGCAVGNGTLNLPALTIGNSYVIVADGQAGDACSWDFITTGVVLPVELSEFEANREINYNDIIWETLSERECDYFAIERSLDGKYYEEIGRVEGANNSTSIKYYNFQDYDQKNQTVYYRLKQVDNNGEFEYHGPKSVIYNTQDISVVTPNPVLTNATINYDFNQNKSYRIVVTDQIGKVISEKSFTSTYKLSNTDLSTTDLIPGAYILKIIENDKIVNTTKFIKL